MRHYKEELVPQKIVNSLAKTTCDLCGGEISEGRFEVNEVEIRHKTGSSYPECGKGKEIEVDMCGGCFTDKLMPWLVSQGANPTAKEWDW